MQASAERALYAALVHVWRFFRDASSGSCLFSELQCNAKPLHPCPDLLITESAASFRNAAGGEVHGLQA